MTDPATPRGPSAPSGPPGRSPGGAIPPGAGNAAGIPGGADEVPDVEVRQGKGLSIVWLVPIIAVAIGAWLWIQAEREKGPEITITFTTADDIEAGKTLIKFKNVNIGKVESIAFSRDLSQVILTASMDRRSEPYLLEATRFWVVRPRIGARGISGLGTLVSGAYIAIEPAIVGSPCLAFTGLESPPVAPTDAPGLKLHLTGSRLGSLGVGSGVYFRDLEAGAVESYELAADGSNVAIELYIEPEFAHLVTTTTHFWSASGISVDMGADGVEVRMESVDALLRGGIAFGQPPDGDAGQPAKSGDSYALLDDRATAMARHFESFTVVAYFTGSVRGLSVGAPVEFRGIPVGEVKDFSLEYDVAAKEFHVPVLIDLHQGVAKRLGLDKDLTPQKMLGDLIGRGLRAQLATGNLVTGALLVEMDVYPDSQAVLRGHGSYLEIPTIPSTSETLENSLSQVSSILENLQDMIARADAKLPELVATAGETSKAVQTTLAQVTASLREFDRLAAESAKLREPAQDAMRELVLTLRSVRQLTNLLEQHPEALIKGKEPGDQ